MAKKQVIAYLHTHWDREWYREFEVFRLRLLRVFDNVLELLEKGDIPSFYFDGHTAALEDYFEMRPENKARVKKLVADKKLFIGPFYCLVDEFLTTKRCFQKNLEIGMKYSRELGCNDFIGYLADTFGHSKNVVKILQTAGIDKCIVWRGCGDIPADFKWCGIDTVNLVRGYFNDFFAQERTDFTPLKAELDKIAEKSADVILMPIGADHLGVAKNIKKLIENANEALADYEIVLGSPFDYFKKVDFKGFEWNDELRDNSKTFILEGSYSSRFDLKRLNSKCAEKLSLVEDLYGKKYKNEIDYAYRMLLQNQAHDSICGCATDAVHRENKIRYEKILQICDTILRQEKFDPRKHFTGVVEFESTEKLDLQCVSKRKGFPDEILYDTQKIPVTEDYTTIYTYLSGENVSGSVLVSDKELKTDKICLKIQKGQIFIGDVSLDFIDFKDRGDSYNTGYVAGDKGITSKILGSKVLMKGDLRCGLRIETTFFNVDAFTDKGADKIRFKINWKNTRKNHLLEARLTFTKPVEKVFSRDFDEIIERKFNPNYNPRENLPKTKGIEVKTNTAPMRDLVTFDGVTAEGAGLTQYEVYKNTLLIPILRATGTISNPKNPARTTPAGPPLETPELQLLGENSVEFTVSL